MVRVMMLLQGVLSLADRATDGAAVGPGSHVAVVDVAQQRLAGTELLQAVRTLLLLLLLLLRCC